MGFVSGMKDMDTILGEWAGALDATTDWTLVDNAVQPYGGICLQHTSGYYLTIRKNGLKWSSGSYSDWEVAGLQVVLSSDYDTVNQQPSGSTQHVYITLFSLSESQGADYNYWDDWITNYMDGDDYYEVAYWIDKYGIVGTISTPFDSPYSYSWGTGSFFAIEVIPVAAREYNDGLTDFFLLTIQNYSVYGSTHYTYARPFNLNTNSRCYDQHERYAYKSLGNGKVYFEFPYYFNDTSRDTPSAQTKRWFLVDDVNTGGIAKGDIINWIDQSAGVTRQFYVSQAWSLERSEVVNVAIPYSNAYEY
jgi:hypothetical protein